MLDFLYVEDLINLIERVIDQKTINMNYSMQVMVTP